jgi:hypothetical protein
MADVGDRVEVLSKAGTRLGVVMRVSGTLVTVEWDTGGQTTVIPAPGVMSVVGRRRAPAKRATTKAVAKRTPVKKATPKKAAPKKAAPKKAAKKKAATKKSGGGKKAAAAKKKGKKSR